MRSRFIHKRSDRRGQDARGDGWRILQEHGEADAGQNGDGIQPRQREQRAEANGSHRCGFAEVALHQTSQPCVEALEFGSCSARHCAGGGGQQDERQRAHDQITFALHRYSLSDRQNT